MRQPQDLTARVLQLHNLSLLDMAFTSGHITCTSGTLTPVYALCKAAVAVCTPASLSQPDHAEVEWMARHAVGWSACRGQGGKRNRGERVMQGALRGWVAAHQLYRGGPRGLPLLCQYADHYPQKTAAGVQLSTCPHLSAGTPCFPHTM